MAPVTRKRFVKYLMGKGLPRNKAEQFAAALNKSKIPYHSCQVDNVLRLSKGSYSGTCVFPKAVAQMLIPKGSQRLETGLSEEDVKDFLYGTNLDMGEAVPVSRIKVGWRESEMREWLNTGPLAPPLPKEWQNLIDASRYAASVYNPS